MKLPLALFLPSIFVLFLCWATLASAVPAACAPSVTLSAWRAVGDDGGVSVALYGGHRLQQITLGVVWQRLPAFPPQQISGVILLPGTSSLLALDAPDDWYDGQSALTLERLSLMSRNRLFAWQVSSYLTPPPLTAGSAAGVVGAAPTPVNGYLYLGTDSPIWLSYEVVVFTGAQLHFIPRRPGQSCALTEAAHVTSGARLLRADGHTVHRLAVKDPEKGELRTWNVTLRVDFAAPQSLMPQEVTAALRASLAHHLHLDPQVDFATGSEVAAAFEFAALPGRGRQTVIVGRRSLRKLATSWAVDASGSVALWVESSESDDVPTAVLWVSAVAGSFLVVAAAHWISYLGHTLRLYYRPSAASRTHPSEVAVTPAHLGLGYAVLVCSTVVHVLMAVWGGHGQLAHAPLAEPLATLIESQWIGSLVAGVLFAVVLIVQSVHEGNNCGKRRTHRPSAVPVQLFGIVMGTSAARGVIAALLVSAGMHLGVLFVTLIAALALAFFATVYSTLVLSAHLFSGVPLFAMPGPERREPGYIVLAWFIWAQQVLLSVLVGVTFSLFLCKPWLDVMNSLYAEELVTGTTMLFFSVPILLASYSVGAQVRRLLDVPVSASSKKAD